MSAAFLSQQYLERNQKHCEMKIKITMHEQILGFQTPGHVEFYFHSKRCKSDAHSSMK